MNTESFLVRTPLLGRDSRFCGYLFHASDRSLVAPYRQLFTAMGADKAPGGLCFIEDTGPSMDELSAEIPSGVTVTLPAGRADCIAPLRARRVGTCARVTSTTTDFPPTLTAVDYVWLDAGLSGELKTAAKAAQRLPGKRIAGAVSSKEQFEDGKELGIQMFEGDWYRRIAGPAPKSVSPGQATVLELIKASQAEAPVAQIEQLLKRDATLSFRLLRYINSAGFGLSCEIQSFRHAVSILGYQNLARWLALLLATSGNTAAAPVLMREAAARGRLTELVGEKYISAEDRDNLFIVGVFSLLPAIMQMPMEQLVDQLSLSESVNDALLTRTGLYGPILRLAESVEQNDAATLARAAADMQLSSAQVNRFHLEALAWANKLSA